MKILKHEYYFNDGSDIKYEYGFAVLMTLQCVACAEVNTHQELYRYTATFNKHIQISTYSNHMLLVYFSFPCFFSPIFFFLSLPFLQLIII